MGRYRNLILAMVAVAFTIASPAQVIPASEWEFLVNNAQKEGRVVMYGSGTGDMAAELSKSFKKKYGIDIELLQARGAEYLAKLLAERRAGLNLVDASIGGATPFFSIVKPANIAVPIEPLLLLKEVKDPTKWRTGKISFLDGKKELVALGATAMPYVVINTDMVKEGEISSFEDLLAPKWKGKICMNDPTILGMGNQFVSYIMSIAYGKEKGTEYLRKLVLQEPVLSRDERLQVEWVAKKKYPIMLAAKPTIVTSFINTGAPLKFISAKEGGLVSGGSLHLYVFDKAPHPNATKLFVNWVLTKEAGEIIARTSGYVSERTDVSAKGFDPAVVPGPRDVLGGEDYYQIQGQMPKVSAEIFKNLLK